MSDNNDWTAYDELLFSEMAVRRDRVKAERNQALINAMTGANGNPVPTSLILGMQKHARDICVALLPFVPPEEPTVFDSALDAKEKAPEREALYEKMPYKLGES